VRALLVNPLFPETYWSQRHALPYVKKRCLLPPLGLITIAALLPEHWDVKIVDLAVEPLTDDQILSADVVMLTGMLAQGPSLHETLARCKRLGARTVVGGPYATSVPEGLASADHIVSGEAEAIMATLASELESGCAKPVYRAERRPDLAGSPIPRYDLLEVDAYHHMALQFSRGCPFACEFCDITAMFGRQPRTKPPKKIIAELEAIRSTGFKGDVFFVDDNFIGNKPAVRELLPLVERWRNATRAPLSFYTEASINLAMDEELMEQMVRSGFNATFVGIETPSACALRETGKLQNTRCDLTDAVHRLLAHGLDVWGGFILGFDSEGEDIFDRMIGFVQKSGIPYAMVGMLLALPNTPLYHRLAREGRLKGLPDARGDQFGSTNFITKLDTRTMLEGYRKVLETIYQPELYFARCRENLRRWMPKRNTRRSYTRAELWAGIRSLLTLGRSSEYRKSYRRFIRWVASHHPSKLGRALAQAIVGHHYMTYTRTVVVPQLERQIAELSEGLREGLTSQGGDGKPLGQSPRA
jgi:radical SAM superfamily enzyme YgiQ (UPF0313 family)